MNQLAASEATPPRSAAAERMRRHRNADSWDYTIDLHGRPRWRQCQFPTNITGGSLNEAGQSTAIGAACHSL